MPPFARCLVTFPSQTMTAVSVFLKSVCGLWFKDGVHLAELSFRWKKVQINVKMRNPVNLVRSSPSWCHWQGAAAWDRGWEAAYKTQWIILHTKWSKPSDQCAVYQTFFSSQHLLLDSLGFLQAIWQGKHSVLHSLTTVCCWKKLNISVLLLIYSPNPLTSFQGCQGGKDLS